MKLGLLADIHEQTEQLRKAIDVLQQHGADRFVVLGDVCEMGRQMEETVRLLQQVDAVGVWGNHDIGLCFDPDESVRQQYSAAVIDFMGSLQPRLEIDGCLFTHVEPWLDPHKIEDLWYFDFIEQGVRHQAPKYMEWYGGFSLLVTLIWMYLEILRLLAKMRGGRD